MCGFDLQWTQSKPHRLKPVLLEHFLSTPIRGTAFFQACGEKMGYQV
jgi:hypothetical protein